MNVLVTGSAGFTGQVLVAQLQAAGHQVTRIDIEPDYLSGTFIQHDLTKPLKQEIVADVVIHLASAVGGFLFNLKEDLIETNDGVNANVLEICKKAGCDHLVFFSSINVFEVNHSFVHDRLVVVDQKSPYARSKARGEFLFSQGMPDCMIIRPTNLFGKAQRRKHQIVGESHVIPDLLRKIESGEDLHVFGDGTQVRNFLHVNDVCEFVVSNLAFSGQCFFNLRSDITITIAQLAKILIEFSGREINITFDPSYMSYELFRITNFDLTVPAHYGWNPKVQTIQAGLLR